MHLFDASQNERHHLINATKLLFEVNCAEVYS